MQNAENKTLIYKFPLQLAASKDFDGKKRLVGMAYLQENQPIFTLKFWTFPKTKFYLLNSEKCAGEFLIMTREENLNIDRPRKYHWNVVGRGKTNEATELIELNFDLFPQKIFMSLYPKEPLDVVFGSNNDAA